MGELRLKSRFPCFILNSISLTHFAQYEFFLLTVMNGLPLVLKSCTPNQICFSHPCLLDPSEKHGTLVTEAYSASEPSVAEIRSSHGAGGGLWERCTECSGKR